MPVRGEVHVWHCDLDAPLPSDAATGLLTADERLRRDRFRHAEDAGRFVAARVFVRNILAAYTGETPAAIGFVSGAGGKPALTPGRTGGKLEFNLTHSGNRACLAIAADTPVGVDLELIRPLDDLLAIAHEVMTGDEFSEFLALDGDDRRMAFYGLWTRKEALLKAAASGFGADPRSCHVGLATDPDSWSHVDWNGQAWTVASFAPAPGAVGAVALAGKLATLRHCSPFAL